MSRKSTRRRERELGRCKRCGEFAALHGGICGSCGDDLRQDFLAEDGYERFLAEDDLAARMYDAREEAFYAAKDREVP